MKHSPAAVMHSISPEKGPRTRGPKNERTQTYCLPCGFAGGGVVAGAAGFVAGVVAGLVTGFAPVPVPGGGAGTPDCAL